jgi:hypothetical protein
MLIGIGLALLAICSFNNQQQLHVTCMYLFWRNQHFKSAFEVVIELCQALRLPSAQTQRMLTPVTGSDAAQAALYWPALTAAAVAAACGATHEYDVTELHLLLWLSQHTGNI